MCFRYTPDLRFCGSLHGALSHPANFVVVSLDFPTNLDAVAELPFRVRTDDDVIDPVGGLKISVPHTIRQPLGNGRSGGVAGDPGGELPASEAAAA